MSQSAPDPLCYRVLVVTGKGGTGKTSVAAALAMLAAARGFETLAIEVVHEGPLQALLFPTPRAPEDDGRTPVRVREHLFALRIDPQTALEEYLELQLHVGGLIRPVVRNPTLRRLLDATPGWRELITLGKIWHLEQQRAGGAPRYGRLIVDAPATGHGLSLLSVPQVVVEMVRLGPLRRQTEQVHSLLRDHARTRILPVTLAEELPVQETLELCARAAELGLCVGPIIANALEPELGLEPLEPLLAALAGLRGAGRLPPLVAARSLERIIEFSALRARLQRGFLLRLRGQLEAGLLTLPRLLEPVEDAAGVSKLALALERALGSAAA